MKRITHSWGGYAQFVADGGKLVDMTVRCSYGIVTDDGAPELLPECEQSVWSVLSDEDKKLAQVLYDSITKALG